MDLENGRLYSQKEINCKESVANGAGVEMLERTIYLMRPP